MAPSPLTGADGTICDVEYTARGNVLPVRHLLILRDKATATEEERPGGSETPSWAQDYALFLLDVNGKIVDWYSGAVRIYGYSVAEASGQHVSFLYPREETSGADPCGELNRSAAEGHFGNEGWHVRKGGSRFWANVITVALRDANEELQGFARVVRDFTARHERDEQLRRNRTRARPLPAESTIASIVSGEFDQIREANDAFLDLLGYSREEMSAGRLYWPDLTPPEYSAFDDLAHEEGLQFGACTPYEKELASKGGTRIPVLVATAVKSFLRFGGSHSFRTFARAAKSRVSLMKT